MRQRLNQFNLPDWFENAHWHTELIGMEMPYVEGELTLFPNGDARLGRRVFSVSMPIDDWPFAGGFIGKRRLDQLEWLVIRLPSGKYNYYRYRRLLGAWEQYIPFEDPVLDKYVAQLGPRAGSFVFEINRGFSALVRMLFGIALAALVFTLGIALWMGFVMAVIAIARLFS